MGKRSSVTLTDVEHQFLKEAQDYFVRETGVDISQAAFITLMCLGILTHERVRGIGISCPKCGYRAEFIRVTESKEGTKPSRA